MVFCIKHKLCFDDWKSLQLGDNRWSDTFIRRVSAQDGLPPTDYAIAIKQLVNLLVDKDGRGRPSASVWISVQTENGTWFAREIKKSLEGVSQPFAVTMKDVPPRLVDFSFYPNTSTTPSPEPPRKTDPIPEDITEAELFCLRVLARLERGFTAEIASLTNMSRPTARQALHGLTNRGLISHLTENEKYPVWEIRRKGLSIALRSWRVPPGASFRARSERNRHSEGRHRRVARLWPAWLRKAWPHADIWAGWSEVSLGGYLRPDALAWGRLHGRETLFVLEVERGNRSSTQLELKAQRKLNRALTYAREFSLYLVFAILGPNWVLDAEIGAFRDLPDDVALVLGDWKAFGELPVPSWGYTQRL